MTVFMRLKRKREEEPPETLIIAAPSSSKKRNRNRIDKALSSLSLDQNTNGVRLEHKFRLLDTFDAAEAKALVAQESEATARLLREANKLNKKKRGRDEAEQPAVWAELTKRPKSQQAHDLNRVHNPAERRLDRVIFDVFQGSVSATEITKALEAGRALGLSANFCRPRDGTTALMAAAWAGSKPEVQALLNLGARPETRDNNGNDAAALATNRGHDGVASMLKIAVQRRATTPIELQEEGIVVVPQIEDDDFVYDIYAYEDEDDDNCSTRCIASPNMAKSLVVGIAQPLKRALSGASPEFASSSSLSSLEADVNDEEDSNAEGHYANDYPDHEDDDDHDDSLPLGVGQAGATAFQQHFADMYSSDDEGQDDV